MNSTPMKIVTKVEKLDFFQNRLTKKSTLKEIQEKKYPFLDSDLQEIFDDLYYVKLIELPEMKCPEEFG